MIRSLFTELSTSDECTHTAVLVELSVHSRSCYVLFTLDKYSMSITNWKRNVDFDLQKVTLLCVLIIVYLNIHWNLFSIMDQAMKCAARSPDEIEFYKILNVDIQTLLYKGHC